LKWRMPVTTIIKAGDGFFIFADLKSQTVVDATACCFI
jgi:hypothetical protein